MEIPKEIADKLVREVDAKQLLTQLNCLTIMTREHISCIIDRQGSQFGMYEIIKELPKVDDWEYDFVKALKSTTIRKKNIADSFNQWIRKEKKFDCLLIHFEHFSCLDSLNAADSSPNWKYLASQMGLSKEVINRIESDHQFNGDFMHYVMDKLAKKKVKKLLSTLEALKLTNEHKEIVEKVSSGQPTWHQNRQAHSYAPSATGLRQPQDDHNQLSGTSKSVDSYLNINRQAEEEKKDYHKLSSSSLTDNRYPTECASLRSDCGFLDVIGDQENKLMKFNNKEKNETTIIGDSSPDDNSSVKATPTYLHLRSNELEMEPEPDYQPDENSLNINERNPDTSTAEEMPDVAPPNDDSMNEIANSDNANENNDDSMNEIANSDNANENNPDFQKTVTTVTIFVGFCILAFLVRRYLRR